MAEAENDTRQKVLDDYLTPDYSEAQRRLCLTELDRVDPLRVLLADEDRAVDFAAKARYEDSVSGWSSVAAPWDALDAEVRGAWRESVQDLRPVLAALREVANGG